jgi:hypothetical protein
MSEKTDIASLSHAELIVLVQQLHQQLAERDAEIQALNRQLAEAHRRSDKDDPDSSPQQETPLPQQEPPSGSQEELLAQLESLYPHGKG